MAICEHFCHLCFLVQGRRSCSSSIWRRNKGQFKRRKTWNAVLTNRLIQCRASQCLGHEQINASESCARANCIRVYEYFIFSNVALYLVTSLKCSADSRLWLVVYFTFNAEHQCDHARSKFSSVMMARFFAPLLLARAQVLFTRASCVMLLRLVQLSFLRPYRFSTAWFREGPSSL